ncbi:MAG: UbiA prenyltransferase family protein [Thermoguttaceae bacterium]|nr:UbiA prenyltransferase family protein [Thermoguttaceae bacterium]
MYSLIQLLRPKHWFKNVFVLFPLLFSGALWTPNVWTAALLSIFATVCFCSWSSAVYILNDICDRESDRQHPRKCNRPIASGKISIPVAITIFILLILVPFAALAGMYFYREEFQKPVVYFSIVGAAYLCNSFVYDFLFRKQVLLDVFCIAIGFVLRILGGCAILLAVPSQWILICGWSMSLFMGFGKRRMECVGADSEYRSSLQIYSSQFLDVLLGVTATCSLLSYMLYTVSSDTIALHNTSCLIYTVPFVFYGIFRFMLDSMSGKHDGPVDAIVSDKPLIICIILWLATAIGILYFFKMRV